MSKRDKDECPDIGVRVKFSFVAAHIVQNFQTAKTAGSLAMAFIIISLVFKVVQFVLVLTYGSKEKATEAWAKRVFIVIFVLVCGSAIITPLITRV